MTPMHFIKGVKLNLTKAKFLILVFLLVGLFACDKTPQAASNENEDGEELSPEYLEQKAKEIEEKTANRFLGEKYRATPLEDVTDTSSYDMPRLQFVWGNEDLGFNRPLIWSVKIDGTDLRKVLDEKTLYEEFPKIIKTPKRSPDHRYLAVVMEERPLNASVIIFNIETKEHKNIYTGAVPKKLAWGPKGDLLYFYDGKYIIWSKNTDKIEKFTSYGKNFLLNNGQILVLGKRKNGMIEKKILDSRFNLISSKKLDIEYRRYMQVNQHGNLLVYRTLDGVRLFQKLDGSNEVIYRDDDSALKGLVFGKNDNIYYSNGESVMKEDIFTKTKEEIVNFPRISFSSLTLYNEKKNGKN